MSVAEMLASASPPRSSCPAGRRRVYADGAPARRPGPVRRRRAGARHLLRLPGDGAGARRRGRAHRAAGVRRHDWPRHRRRRRRCFDGQPGEQSVWMSHGDAVHAAPEGFRVTADDRRHAGGRVRGRRAGGSTACSGTPRCCTPTVRAAGARELPVPRRRHRRRTGPPGNVVDEQVDRDPRRRSATTRVHLRAVRRGGLRGGRRAGAAGGRRPADLRVRRPRAAARGRGRAGRAGLRRGDRRRSGRRRRARALPRRAGRGHRPGDQAQDHRPGVHPGLRAGGPRRRRVGAAHGGARSRFLVQGTLYPDVVESGGGDGAANIKSHHNVGGLPDDLQFELVEPLRTLFKDEVRQVGARARAARGDRAGGSRSPAPGSASGSSARSTRERLAILRARRRDRPRGDDGGRPGPRDLAVPGRAAGRRPVGGRAGRRPHLRPPDRAAAGVQRGRDDGRLDAGCPTTCWPRISTRITNEVPEVNRVVLDVTSKPPGTIEWE